MSAAHMTKGQLLAYNEQLTAMEQQGSVLMLLMGGRIRDFYSEFGIRINTLLKERFSIVAKYHETAMVPDGKGGEVEQLIWETDEEGKRKGYKLREGMNHDDFQKEWVEWNKSPVTSIITTGPLKVVN